jgi:hypothetical protein
MNVLLTTKPVFSPLFGLYSVTGFVLCKRLYFFLNWQNLECVLKDSVPKCEMYLSRRNQDRG